MTGGGCTKNVNIEATGQGRRSSVGQAGLPAGPRSGGSTDKDVCGYCNHKVTASGKGSEGLCCDLCLFWVHTDCEGISSADYKLWKKLERAKFYCNFRKCEQKVSNGHPFGKDGNPDVSGSDRIDVARLDYLEDKLNNFRNEILQAIDSK